MRSKTTLNNSHSLALNAALLADIAACLKAARRILVASHIDPDGDALGTQLAFAAYARHLGKDVFLVRDGEIPEKYRFLPGSGDIRHVSELPDDFDVDTALVLECPDIARVGRASRYLTDSVKIINIDHHYDNSNFGAINWLNTSASSVGEMAFEYFAAAGYKIDARIAEQLYTAIMTDTGRFRFASTSPRTMQIVADLIAAGAEPQKICDNVYYNLRPAVIKLIGKVLNHIAFHHNGTICELTLTRDMLASSGAKASDSDGLIDFTLFSADVEAGVLFKEVDTESTRVSFRSKDGINVAELAARFGGGGHFNASGCSVPMSLERARSEIIGLLKEAIDEQTR